MSVSPTAAAATSGSSASQLASSTGGCAQTGTVERAARVSMNVLAEGLSICRRHKAVCAMGVSVGASACYSHRATGSLVRGSDDIVHILTVAHAFNDEPEEYMLQWDGEPLVFFIHGNPKGDKHPEPDIAFIPVGKFDPQKQSVRFKDKTSLNGMYHLHPITQLQRGQLNEGIGITGLVLKICSFLTSFFRE